MKTTARIHAILPRRGVNAVVFRCGPSASWAVIGWDLAHDTFTLGQWLKGSMYPLRSDLSPKGTYLLYFAAKFNRPNAVEKFVEEKVTERVGELYDGLTFNGFRKYLRQREEAEAAVRKEFAGEIRKLRYTRDYTDRSWTAISRAPYLKALDLWFNGSGWNGGGKFIDEKTVWINKPLPIRGEHFHHQQSRRFKELAEPPVPEWETQNGGEDPGIYFYRLLRDGWQENKKWKGRAFCWEKPLKDGLILRKYFDYLKGYYETHAVLDAAGKPVLDGKDWEWADFDAARKRIVYAAQGAIFAISLRGTKLEPRLLRDFNDMKFEAIPAPY